jgi:integrase/recombinase XerD
MLARAVQSYLDVRRAAGYALRHVEPNLRSFAAYCDGKGHRYVTAHLAIEWARQSSSATQRARRLADVKRFAVYVHADDARHEIPPEIFGKERGPRPTAYILSDHQICQIIRLAAQSGYRTLRRQTYSTFFALLACTGLRVSEAINLRYDDIAPDGLIAAQPSSARAVSSLCMRRPAPGSNGT